jgi:ATP-dependent Clp protease ATP-binding subunit ClpC
MDASNIIKPALSRGELQCVGATTLAEYRKFIEKDAALERRFQSVKVEAPSVEEAILILKGLRSKYEAHHKAHFTDESLAAAVKLSDRYLTDRQLPDKAIDVMDEAGIRSSHFEKAASLRDQEKALREEYETKLAEWKSRGEEETVTVDEEQIYQVVSKWTGIPLQRMTMEESQKLLRMGEEMKTRVVGQNEAVDAICRALRRSRADLRDPKRPIGSFAFLGPTGVGKTLLAKTMAEYMFGRADALIQIDMSEYAEKFNVSRLIGSPPGYVGYEEGGQLTERVRRKPYCVVLFDEIEKAHPDVWNILLQILEDGQLTDSLGRKVDFRNTLIILTSNVGAELIKKSNVMGFGVAQTQDSYEVMRERIIEQAKRVFKPEFLNRLDDLIVFHSLTKDDLKQVVRIEVDKLIQRLRFREIVMELSDATMEFLIEKGYDPAYGARPLRRAVERWLEDPLAEMVLEEKVKPTSIVKVDMLDGKPHFTVENPPPVEIEGEQEEATSNPDAGKK